MEDWASFQTRVATLGELEKKLSLAKAIAASGFYKNDIGLTCFACNLKVNYNDLGDNPDAVHISLKPSCSFVRQELSERISFKWKTPENPEFTSYESRIVTFEEWPLTVVSAPQLALAGFFYRGDGDKAVCYCCNVILKHWERGDDPLTEHAKLKPDCDFILLVKGREFIEQCERSANDETELEQIEEDENDSEGISDEYDKDDESDFGEDCIEEIEKCLICLTNSLDTVLDPCGHSICGVCSFKVSTCPECRGDITGRIKPLV